MRILKGWAHRLSGGSLRGVRKDRSYDAILFHNVVELGTGFEFYGFASGDFDNFLCTGIDAFAGCLFRNCESTETDEGYFVALGKLFANCVDGGFESGLGLNLCKVSFLSDSIDKLCLVHND